MTDATTTLSESAQDFTWLLAKFARETAGVVDVIAVSSDGLLMATAEDADRATSDRLSAIVSGMASLAAGAGTSYGLGALNKVIIDAEGGFLVVMAMGAGALLGAVADTNASLATVAYEMAVFINRINGTLNPRLINELKNSVN
ncbi:MAG: roadblock/LC7 domain-containing protein [Kineosporiaceae bacterium]|nr:roadblock/LC7 domain-containing protein [Kineosporiaceae bacterium]MBK7624247.1 roadblock/LC7 domain-containing protein [Kineosporiaceae bacterium]MBK8075281.1 roadblock/LC7 domain-containing protein [Kineosporiaceae bacterium]